MDISAIPKGVLSTLIVLFVLETSPALGQSAPSEFRLKDAVTTIKIAKAALEQEFGNAEVRRLKSFEANLVGDKWIVYGHPYKRLKPNQAPPYHGGSYDVEIAVDRATILAIRAEM